MSNYVLVGSSNGSSNLGDASMWEAAAAFLRTRSPQCGLITDSRPGWVPPLPHVETLPFLHESFRRFSRAPRNRGETALQLLGNTGVVRKGLRRAEQLMADRRVRLTQEELAWAERLEAADALVIAGAGGVTDEFALHGVAGWLAVVALARRVGTPAAMVGQGVGPLVDRHVRQAARHLLQSCQLVTTRDEESRSTAAALAPGSTPVATPDWAIALPVSQQDHDVADQVHDDLLRGHPFLAVSVHHRKTAGRREMAHLRERTSALLAAAGAAGLDVLMVPNSVSSRRNDDRLLQADIAADSASVRVACVQDRLSASQTRALLARARALVSTRYHPVVFALAEGVPAHGLSFDAYYDQKLRGALRWYGEDERVVRLEEQWHPRDVLTTVLSADRRPDRTERTRELLPQVTEPLERWLETACSRRSGAQS